MARGPRALRPVENQPTAHGARARWRTWRGCLRSQRAARSIPRRWPRLFFTDTAPGRRLRLRNVVTYASDSVARGPRALRPVENSRPPTGSTRALADLAWLSLRPTRGALHPTPLAEALLHRHRARSAAAASKRRDYRIRIPWRATRARFAPWRTSRPPTEHAGAGGLGVVVFAANARRAPSHAVGRGSSSPTPRQVDGCGFERRVTASEFRGARPARASPRGEPADRPQEHARAGGLGVVVFAANARRAPSHAVGRGSSSPTPRQVGGCGFETSLPPRPTPCRAARARFAPWRTGRSTKEHARAGGLGVVVFAANTRRAPPHAVGRGSSSPTPRQVGGCGFERRDDSFNSVSRGPRALRPVKNQPTAHRARARWRTWRGCLRSQRGTRSTSRRWPRLFFTDTAPGRRLRLRNVVASASDSRGARPARASPRGEQADRPRSTRALADLAWLSLRPTRDALHPHAVGRGSSSPTPRQVGGCGFETCNHCIELQWRAARARFAPWRTSRPPTEHAGAGGLGVVVFAANARRAPSHAVGRVSSSPTPRQVGGCGFETSLPPRPTPCRAARVRFAPWRTGRSTKGARARWRTWRGCLCGQHATRSTPRRWPRLFFTDTAPGRRLRLRNA